MAAENARRKALAGAAQAAAGELVLGVDTLVTIDGEVIGKPADATEALAVLARLAGRAHEVLGGLALAQDGALVAEALEATEVRFRALPDATLRWYVATGEWHGRAGGYAVQGAGAVLVAGLRATTSTSWGSRSRACSSSARSCSRPAEYPARARFCRAVG